MAQHTPGPWAHNPYIAGQIIGPNGNSICDVHGSSEFGDEDDANQALITSAPDLLAALDKAESFIAGFEDDETQDGIDDLLGAIRAAIAKAKA